MIYLFDHWDSIQKQIKNRKLALFLDYDGTLSPIVKTPQLAKTPARIKKLLKKISSNPSFKIAIISGRALGDLKRKVGIKKIIYSGNHGLEIEAFGKTIKNKAIKGYKRIHEQICFKLKSDLSDIRGKIIEDKGLTLSLHYRLMAPKDIGIFKRKVNLATKDFKKKGLITINQGKKVIEIKPKVNWNKGKAVSLLLSKINRNTQRYYPVYIGDDVTDNDAFKVLYKKGLTVYVGEKSSKFKAHYFIKNTGEVYKFLERIHALKMYRTN
jgi:trehalose-phosphatase